MLHLCGKITTDNVEKRLMIHSGMSNEMPTLNKFDDILATLKRCETVTFFRTSWLDLPYSCFDMGYSQKDSGYLLKGLEAYHPHLRKKLQQKKNIRNAAGMSTTILIAFEHLVRFFF